MIPLNNKSYDKLFYSNSTISQPITKEQESYYNDKGLSYNLTTKTFKMVDKNKLKKYLVELISSGRLEFYTKSDELYTIILTMIRPMYVDYKFDDTYYICFDKSVIKNLSNLFSDPIMETDQPINVEKPITQSTTTLSDKDKKKQDKINQFLKQCELDYEERKRFVEENYERVLKANPKLRKVDLCGRPLSKEIIACYNGFGTQLGSLKTCLLVNRTDINPGMSIYDPMWEHDRLQDLYLYRDKKIFEIYLPKFDATIEFTNFDFCDWNNGKMKSNGDIDDIGTIRFRQICKNDYRMLDEPDWAIRLKPGITNRMADNERKKFSFNYMFERGLSPKVWYSLLARQDMYDESFKIFQENYTYGNEVEYETWLVENGLKRKNIQINGDGVKILPDTDNYDCIDYPDDEDDFI